MTNKVDEKAPASLLDALYGLKKKCWGLFEQYEEVLSAVDKGCDLKLGAFSSELKQCKKEVPGVAQKSEEPERSACSSEKSEATSSRPLQ